MKSSEYWKKRFELLEQKQHQIGVQCFDEIEKQFRQAERQLEGQLSSWYRRFADNNGITMQEAKKWLTATELDEFKWDVNQYIQYGQDNAINGQWVKELENASARYHISRLEALKLQTQQTIEALYGNQLDSLDRSMKDVYRSGFYHTAFEIQKGFGVGWDFGALDDKHIAKVVNTPWATDGKNFSARVWDNRTKLINELNAELTRNIITGADPQKAIDAISRKLNASKKAVGRLVMTEEAFFSSAAQKDCFNELDVEQFEVVATLDSHTSEICQGMDGKHFPMSQWEIGVTAPPFHPYCRSTTVPYFDDDLGSVGERAARGSDGKTYHIPANMTYEDWKKSFVDGGTKTDLNIVDTNLDDLEKQFKELTDGYSYDDFINDFGSIEEGFDGADEGDIIRAKNISNQIEKLKQRTSSTREQSIQALKNIGIDFRDNSKEMVSDDIVHKFSKFITNFEQKHSHFFNMNELQLNSISIFDEVTVGKNRVAGAYYPESQTIKLMKKSVVTRPTSKLITYSNSDDYELHFLAHEYGHYIADSLEKTLSVSDTEIIQRVLLKYFDGDIFRTKTSNLIDVLGSYGAKNPQEAFAEAFAEAYTCEEPCEFVRLFKEELEETLKRKN